MASDTGGGSGGGGSLGDGYNSIGFNVAQFSAAVDDTLICIVCQNVVEDAAECPCGHLFCGAHIRGWLSRGNPSCPACRTTVKLVDLKSGSDLHLSYRRLLSELRMKCINSPFGCGHEAAPGDTKRHEQQGCDFKPVFCKWYGCAYHSSAEPKKSLKVQELDMHQNNCPKRLVKCTLMGCNEYVCSDEIDGHSDLCQKVEVRCTVKGCDLSMPRGSLAAHLADTAAMPKHITLLTTEVASLAARLNRPEVVHKEEILIRIPDAKKKLTSPAFRYESKVYTLGVVGQFGYNFRVQMRKRRWPEDKHHLSDKVGLYLHMERGEADELLDWPFPYNYTFTILDQNRQDPAHISALVHDGATRGVDWLTPGSGKGWGPQGVADCQTLLKGSYCKNDVIFIKVTFRAN